MDQGVIEQVGTPQEIYGSPATSFVADFIGTMNFLSGSVEGDGSVRVGGATLACSTDGMTENTPVSVAIRPEDIDAEDIDAEDIDAGDIDGRADNVVDVEITHMEFLGSFYRAGLGGPSFSDHEIRADFSINLVRRKDLAVGSHLPVRLPSQFIRIYPAG
jgi:iron(III) transport system ATP-binding protein